MNARRLSVELVPLVFMARHRLFFLATRLLNRRTHAAR